VKGKKRMDRRGHLVEYVPSSEISHIVCVECGLPQDVKLRELDVPKCQNCGSEEVYLQTARRK